eukprot:g2960.t1
MHLGAPSNKVQDMDNPNNAEETTNSNDANVNNEDNSNDVNNTYDGGDNGDHGTADGSQDNRDETEVDETTDEEVKGNTDVLAELPAENRPNMKRRLSFADESGRNLVEVR